MHKKQLLPPKMNDQKGGHEDCVQREVKQSGKKSKEEHPGEKYTIGQNS